MGKKGYRGSGPVLWSRSCLHYQETSNSVHRSAGSSTHSQTLHGYTSSVGVGTARPQQEGPGPTGTPEVLGCSPLSKDWRPTNITQLALYSLCGVPTNGAQLHNIRQTNQYMPVIHVSCACFRETVLHKSAFHLCLLQQNVLSHLPQQNTIQHN